VLDHPHAELARPAWEAASSSDIETLTRMTTDAITWHASGRGLRTGDFRGRTGIIADGVGGAQRARSRRVLGVAG